MRRIISQLWKVHVGYSRVMLYKYAPKIYKSTVEMCQELPEIKPHVRASLQLNAIAVKIISYYANVKKL